MSFTSAFIDLATYDEIESHLYEYKSNYTTSSNQNNINSNENKGNTFLYMPDKSSWNANISNELEMNPRAEFGTKSIGVLNCQSDYLTRLYLQMHLGQVKLAKKYKDGLYRLRWTRNFAHNIISELKICYDKENNIVSNKSKCYDTKDNILYRCDNLTLDFTTAFKNKDEYFEMIGNRPELINPTSIHYSRGTILPETILNLPLNINTYCKCIIPLVSISNYAIYVCLLTRTWTDLLILDDFETGISRPVNIEDLESAPTINISVMRDSKIVDNSQRHEMINNPNNFMIEYTETSIYNQVSEYSNVENLNIDMTSTSGSMCRFYFGLKNKYNSSDHSNYTSTVPFLSTRYVSTYGHHQKKVPSGVIFNQDKTSEEIYEYLCNDVMNFLPTVLADIIISYIEIKDIKTRDPIGKFQFYIGGTERLNYNANFYSIIHPFNIGAYIPTDVGYHIYSFADRIDGIGPSINFDKLNGHNPVFIITPINDINKDQYDVELYRKHINYSEPKITL